MQSLFIVLFWLFFGFLCSKIAKKKNRNTFSWFLLGLLFGLLALICIYFIKPLKVATQNNSKTHPSISNLHLIQDDKNYWYYLDIAQKQIGPVSIKKIFDDYFEGIISDNTFVWNDTMSNWKKLKEVSIFSKIQNKLPE